MPKQAIWKDQVIAESDETVKVEGNDYFPVDSLKQKFFHKTDYHTVCPWKGTANYYSVKVDGETNENAAWYYPEPKSAAAEIKDHVAFWRGVEVKTV